MGTGIYMTAHAHDHSRTRSTPSSMPLAVTLGISDTDSDVRAAHGINIATHYAVGVVEFNIACMRACVSRSMCRYVCTKYRS
jgi:hypothetical protein